MGNKKHNLVYKTTNLLNGKIYIGQHQTDDLADGYIGSGVALMAAIKKYGRENFRCEILYDFATQKEMDDKERELVQEVFISRKGTYNMIPGGADGLWSISSELRAKANRTRWRNLSEAERKHYVEAAHKACLGRPLAEAHRKRVSLSLKKTFEADPTRNGMYGKKHSLSTRLKMRQAHTGERNNQFGKMWICNEVSKESKVILKTEPIPEGWRRGRFCKKGV